MRVEKIVVFAFLALSPSAFANVEIEIAAARAKHVLQNEGSQFNLSIPCQALDFYVGYRLKKFPLSLGLLASQKNYDMAELSRDLSANAKSFYEDPNRFPSVADVGTAKSSGSRRGLVYGPQMSISLLWKHFAPYLRVSYQLGNLQNTIDYKSTGNYMGAPLAYDFQIDGEVKASLLQYAVGFRIPFGISYLFVDLGMEKMKTTADGLSLTEKATQSGFESIQEKTYSDDNPTQSRGLLSRLGVGLSF